MLNARLFQDSSQQLAPIISPSNKAWDYRVEPFKLPPYTRLMLADVDAGSDTPSLVGKVLKWRKENSEDAKARWDALDALNQKLSRVLLHLSVEEAKERLSRDGPNVLTPPKKKSALRKACLLSIFPGCATDHIAYSILTV